MDDKHKKSPGTTKNVFPVYIQNFKATAGRNFQIKTEKLSWLFSTIFSCLATKIPYSREQKLVSFLTCLGL